MDVLVVIGHGRCWPAIHLLTTMLYERWPSSHCFFCFHYYSNFNCYTSILIIPPVRIFKSQGRFRIVHIVCPFILYRFFSLYFPLCYIYPSIRPEDSELPHLRWVALVKVTKRREKVIYFTGKLKTGKSTRQNEGNNFVIIEMKRYPEKGIRRRRE